jgi:hypothetical protein
MAMKSLLLAMMFVGAVLISGPAEGRADDLPPLAADQGPYMIVAHTFKGEKAEDRARTLAMELRADHGVAAYVYPFQKAKQFTVLVGEARSMEEARALQKRVKTIKPKCLAGIGEEMTLRRATVTINPLAPSEAARIDLRR